MYEKNAKLKFKIILEKKRKKYLKNKLKFLSKQNFVMT